MTEDFNLLDWRRDTPGCSEVIHLNNAGASLMPSSVSKVIKDYLELESLYGGYETAARESDNIFDFYNLAARLLNCRPENIAFTSSATDSYTRALSSIPFKEGDTILTSEDDYVSNQIAFLYFRNRFGIRVERIRSMASGGLDPEDARLKIKRNRPKLVAATHIPTNSGLIQDVASLGQICSEEGIWYLVDACQSVGQMPVDTSEISCDFLSTTCRKFLRGPRGAGFLFVSDRALNAGLAPIHLDMRGAQWIGADNFILEDTARRFEDWEFAYALVRGTAKAIEYALDIGLNRIENRLKNICRFTREKLGELNNLTLLDRGDELGAIISLQVLNHSEESIRKLLYSHKINHSLVSKSSARIDFEKKNVDWALRISPHYYNTEEEIQSLIGALS